jgi:hypothetical protein
MVRFVPSFKLLVQFAQLFLGQEKKILNRHQYFIFNIKNHLLEKAHMFTGIIYLEITESIIQSFRMLLSVVSLNSPLSSQC